MLRLFLHPNTSYKLTSPYLDKEVVIKGMEMRVLQFGNETAGKTEYMPILFVKYYYYVLQSLKF